MKFERGYRRAQIERLKENRKVYYGGYAKEIEGRDKQRLLSLWATTAQVCSCYMCGNPRKHWKQKTLKERQFLAESLG